ncbi:MAG TPA: DUF6325 family protein [Acidimicrobiales bacterium]|nr:DUF6325 family protein [Acidimicrobiales bacterium]
MSDSDVHGPIDFLLLEFQGKNLKGEVADALMDLVDRGIVRVFDALVVVKEADGSFSGVNLTDLSADDVGSFQVFAGARSGLLGDDDIAEAASAMEPGTVAALIVYENTWAIPFVAAARRAGAEVIASARIPAQDVMDALEALETTS